ncbi:MAG TPA: ABC transporter ATP-binding protein [Pyrinomonadaceae bacterium]
MTRPIIKVEGLSKLYHPGARPGLRPSLGEALAGALRSPLAAARARRAERRDGPLWALKDVSFEVGPGETVGIIGHNGAGKSTLLKVLARVTRPTSGGADLHGRVGGLLELGTGFHPELTGRENIYLNGALLGMRRREIARKFDEIVAFAETERFLDTPVKHYSSGMYLRLAFAVAAHLETEILLLDEVLAVGDAAFQRKCLGKMREASARGRTVLFVSHNMAAVQQMCGRVLLIQGGELREEGEAGAVVARYLDRAAQGEGGDFDLSNNPSRLPGCTPVIERVRLLAGGSEATTRFRPDDVVTVELFVNPAAPISGPRLALSIEDHMGRRITTAASYFQPDPLADIDAPGRFRCRLPPLRLGEGRYLLSVSVANSHQGMIDALHGAVWFEVVWRDSFGNGEPYSSSTYGPVLTASTWERVD